MRVAVGGKDASAPARAGGGGSGGGGGGNCNRSSNSKARDAFASGRAENRRPGYPGRRSPQAALSAGGSLPLQYDFGGIGDWRAKDRKVGCTRIGYYWWWCPFWELATGQACNPSHDRGRVFGWVTNAEKLTQSTSLSCRDPPGKKKKMEREICPLLGWVSGLQLGISVLASDRTALAGALASLRLQPVSNLLGQLTDGPGVTGMTGQGTFPHLPNCKGPGARMWVHPRGKERKGKGAGQDLRGLTAAPSGSRVQDG